MPGEVTQADVINAATKVARAQAQQRIDEQARQLEQLIGELASDIQSEVQRYAGADGTVNIAQIPTINDYLDGRLSSFLQSYHGLIEDSLVAAAALGADVLKFTGSGTPQSSLVQDVLQFVRDFRDARGLDLSSRIWRVSENMSSTISQAIQNGIVRGYSANQAARDYIAQGVPVPDDIAAEAAAGGADSVGRAAADALLNPDAGISTQAAFERVLRTEMNRAYTQAYATAALQHPDAAGVKFNLSPAHPRADICDLYANANLYGLGPGVYPDASSCPYPAHPNTLSFLTTVFNDQVSAEDQDGRESWQEWLKDQPEDVQDSVLGSQDKGSAFRSDQLDGGDLRRPWKDIAPRLGVST